MSKPNHTLPASYFDDVYSHHDDPWSFETSAYEKEKYEATIAALPKPLYESAFEIGCSIGVLTRMLAPRCKFLLSVDIADAALANAKRRLKDYPQVSIQKMAVPGAFPQDSFELILVSEVGYYLSKEDLHLLIQKIINHLQPNGHLLLVHWTPVVPDYPLTGDEVHEAFLREVENGKPFQHLLHKRKEKYRLDLFQKI